MRFVRALRTVGAIGLKRAIDLAIHFDRFRRSVLVAGVELHVAEHLSAALREAGTEVELQECSISTPMLCTPEVNAKYVWGALRMLKVLAAHKSLRFDGSDLNIKLKRERGPKAA